MVSVDFVRRVGRLYSMTNLFKAVIIRLSILAIIVCSIALVLTDDVKADDYMTGMVGVFNSGKQSYSETKLLNVGHRDYLGLGLSYQYEVGGFIDRAGEGRSGSGYGAFQIGVEAGDTTVARVMAGPSIITTPDAYLGGPFEMQEDFFLGIRGHDGNMVGVMYKHISSGGIYQPNVGRDFFGVQVSIPW